MDASSCKHHQVFLIVLNHHNIICLLPVAWLEVFLLWWEMNEIVVCDDI